MEGVESSVAAQAAAKGGGPDFAAVFAILALVAALIVPLVLLLRTQKDTAKEEVRPPHLDHPAFSSFLLFPPPAITNQGDHPYPNSYSLTPSWAEGLRSPSYARCHWQPCLR